MAEFRARLAAFSADARAIMAEAVEAGADEMVEAARAACPLDPTLEQRPGDLKASIHKKDGNHELQKRVVADAVDAKGKFYGAHVELGHNSRDGTHVPAHPFFYPAWRLTKKRAMSRIAHAIKAAASGETSSGS